MDNMNSNRYLNERAIQESIKGEPARYNQAHRALNPMARYLAELKQMDEERENQEEAGDALSLQKEQREIEEEHDPLS